MHSKIQEFIFENSVVTCRSRLCTACTHQKSTSSLQIFIFSVFWHFGISHRYLYYNFIFRNVQQKQIQIHLAMCVMYTRHDLLGITTNTNAMRHYLSQRAMNTTTTTAMRNGDEKRHRCWRAEGGSGPDYYLMYNILRDIPFAVEHPHPCKLSSMLHNPMKYGMKSNMYSRTHHIRNKMSTVAHCANFYLCALCNWIPSSIWMFLFCYFVALRIHATKRQQKCEQMVSQQLSHDWALILVFWIKDTATTRTEKQSFTARECYTISIYISSNK